MKYRAISQVTLANMLLFVGCDSDESQPTVAANIENSGPDSSLAVEDEHDQAERVVETLRGLGFKGARWAKRGSEDIAAIGAYQPSSNQNGQLGDLFSSSADNSYARRSSVVPRIECVEKNGQTVSAYWGYDNTTGESVEIPVSWRNKFFPGQSENGQPTEFEPGLHEFAFSNEFAANRWLAWILDGKFRIATSWSKKCGQNADIEPSVCVTELDNGDFEAHFSYDNKGRNTERVAIGPRNRVRPGARDQGQPELFLPGEHDDVFSVTFKKNRRKVWRLTGKRAIANKNTERCEPDDSCTNDEMCSDQDACTGIETCNLNTGECVDAPDLQCEDNNECTADSCDAIDGCKNDPVPDGTVCDNNGTPGTCNDGSCIGCTDDSQCNDNDTCNGEETCNIATGICENGTPLNCNNNDVCDGVETCDPTNGCQPGTPEDCEDNNECTADSCDAIDGCKHEDVPDGTVCDNNGTPGTCSAGDCIGCVEDADCQDDTVCNGLEACTNGVCVSGSPLDCEDDNVCDGVEVCDPADGCQDGTPLDCDDNEQCTADSCDEIEGCKNEAVADGTVCDNNGNPGVCEAGMCKGCVTDQDCTDDDVCTGQEACVEGACVSGQELDCDNNNVCDGLETCDPVDGCQDGTPEDCEDNNDCTADSCDEVEGCKNEAVADGTVCDNNGNPGVCEAGMCKGCLSDSDCADDDVCDGEDTCVDSVCVEGTPLDCEDNNDCTADSCDAINGCLNEAVADGTVCDNNGNPGVCSAGVCGNCGSDVDCQDDTVCNGLETCVNSECVDGTALDCEDNNDCTADSCDEVNGCVNEAVADGTPCADGTCQTGMCVGAPLTLNHSGRGSFNSRFVVENTLTTWKVIAGSYQIRNIGGFAGESAPGSRDYFTFSLDGVEGTVATAELRITHPANSYDSDEASETITLYDVSTATNVLESPPDGGPIEVLEDIFSDLGTGNEYGSFTADDTSNDTVEVIPLNAAAIADIQAAIASGSDWSVGGSLTSPAASLPFGELERVFRGSDNSGGGGQPDTELVLTGVTKTTPETTITTLQAADVGYYLHATNNDSGVTLQSFHWESPANEHRSYFTGNQTLAAFSTERRPYYAFDLASIAGKAVTSVKFRYWAWKPALANAGSGAYESGDASETVVFRSLDNHSASDVINAPFNQTTDHTIDLPIWTDLGDGEALGTRVHSADDETTNLIPSPTTDQSTNCADADVACGKWIEVTLNNLAEDQIEGESGMWAMGAHMTTIDGNATNSGKEWVNNGALVDLSPDKAPYPDFLTPLPELVVEHSI